MVPIFHRQRSLAPKLTRFGMSLLWAKVKSKKSLIDELKRSVKRIRDSVVGPIVCLKTKEIIYINEKRELKDDSLRKKI